MTVANRAGHSIHPVIGDDYVRLVSGKGVFVTDDTGKSYLDAVAGIGVVALGYGRDDLVDAYADQARRLPFAQSMRFENDAAERLADRLAAFAPAGPDLVVLLQRRLGGPRFGGQARPPVLARPRAALEVEGHRSPAGLPRQHADGAVGRLSRRSPGALPAVHHRPAAPARAVDLPLRARRRHGTARTATTARAGARGADRGRGPRDGRRVHRRAADRGRGAGGHAARRLLPDDPRDLRPLRRAVHQRRGHDRDRPHGPELRDRALGRGPGPHAVREGHLRRATRPSPASWPTSGSSTSSAPARAATRTRSPGAATRWPARSARRRSRRSFARRSSRVSPISRPTSSGSSNSCAATRSSATSGARA